MEEVMFLFLYHELTPVVQTHFDLVRKFHGREEIVPLDYHLRGAAGLPGTLDIARAADCGWPIRKVW